MSVKTCPKCGRLIAPQLARCRGCKTYLHGNRLEGLLMGAVPEPLRAAPTTALLFVAIAVVYLMLAVLALPSSPLAFSTYTLVQAGGTATVPMARGQWWRLITSLFVHHDVVHLAFNLYCLALVGPIVEQLFGRKKTLLLYLATGAFSMAISHVWYTELLRSHYVSAGASGAVCGLIGLAWLGATRSMPQQTGIADGMKRWAIMLAVWGFVVPGINNAAHFGGFIAGIALGRVVPLGAPKNIGSQRVYSAASGLSLLGVLACATIAITGARPHPWSLEDDMNGAWLMGVSVSGDLPVPEDSTQQEARNLCFAAVAEAQPDRVILHSCEFAVRAVPHMADPAYHFLAEAERRVGRPRRAARVDRARELVRELSQ